MRLDSAHIYIRPLDVNDVHELTALRTRNREFLQPFEPIPSENHYTIVGQREILEKVQMGWQNGSSYGFGIFDRETHQLIGRVNLSNVVRGAWESCTMGYFLDETLGGLGYTTEAVKLALQFAFGQAELHRVQAAVMPRNHASIRVLEKAGFRYEGFAEYYLKINGIWEHHNLYSITREYFTQPTDKENLFTPS